MPRRPPPPAAPARTLFGTDGVRGVANLPPMTPEKIGRAHV